jgi:DNA-binding transcriptional MerR regulator
MDEKDWRKDYLTIKEFAEYVGMSVSALRYYDNKNIFKPARHGMGIENKYRYYAPTQITMVKMIRVLTEVGVPLKVIKEMSKSREPVKVAKLLNRNREKVADEIHYLQEVYSVIDVFADLISEGMRINESEITVLERPAKNIILGAPTDFSEVKEFYGEFIRFCNSPHVPKLNTSYPIGGYWSNMAAFLEEPSLPMRFFSLDAKGHEQMDAGLYLTGYTRGYYGQTNDLPKRMAAFAKKNGIQFSGPVYNTYLFDEISMDDPQQYLLQVTASVTETRRVQSRRPRRIKHFTQKK